MAKVILNVPEDVHIRVSRVSKKAVDLKELIYSHILLPVRARFGREAQFEWIQSQDWINFCNGEKIQIFVRIAGQTNLAMVYHGEDRVVFVKQVDEVAK